MTFNPTSYMALKSYQNGSFLLFATKIDANNNHINNNNHRLSEKQRKKWGDDLKAILTWINIGSLSNDFLPLPPLNAKAADLLQEIFR